MLVFVLIVNLNVAVIHSMYMYMYMYMCESFFFFFSVPYACVCACKHFIILFYCTSDVHRMWFCVCTHSLLLCTVWSTVHMFFVHALCRCFRASLHACTHACMNNFGFACTCPPSVCFRVCLCLFLCVCLCLCLCVFVFAYKLVDVYFLLISFLLCFSSSLSPPSFLTQTQSA